MGGEDDGILRDKIVMDPARAVPASTPAKTKIKETIRVRISMVCFDGGLDQNRAEY